MTKVAPVSPTLTSQFLWVSSPVGPSKTGMQCGGPHQRFWMNGCQSTKDPTFILSPWWLLRYGPGNSRWADPIAHSLQAFTGKVPFYDLAPAATAVVVLAGKRPARPTYPVLTNDLWEIVKRCWNQEPRHRPDISEVVLCLRNDVDPLCDPFDAHDDRPLIREFSFVTFGEFAPSAIERSTSTTVTLGIGFLGASKALRISLHVPVCFQQERPTRWRAGTRKTHG
jgi:hypothetical protein